MAGGREWLTLYQVGDLKINLISAQEWHGSDIGFISEPKELLNNPFRLHWCETCHGAEKRKYKVDGIVIPSNCMDTNTFLNRLHLLGGCVQDLFAYSNLSCCQEYPNCGCAKKSDCSLLWLHNRGVISDIKVSDKDAGVVSISFTLVTEQAWSGLNRFMFNWGVSQPNPFYIEDVPLCDCEVSYIPSCDVVDSRCSDFKWYKRTYCDELVFYTPNLWKALQGNVPIGYRGVGSYAEGWLIGSSTVHIDISNDLWNAPPSSIYSFTNLPQAGYVDINVTGQRNTWTVTETMARVDLSKLNSDLAAATGTGLKLTDILVIGDVPDLPGFIIRSDSPFQSQYQITNVYPAVVYDGYWPGILSARANKVHIVVPGTSRFAFMHTFRRF